MSKNAKIDRFTRSEERPPGRVSKDEAAGQRLSASAVFLSAAPLRPGGAVAPPACFAIRAAAPRAEPAAAGIRAPSVRAAFHAPSTPLVPLTHSLHAHY